MPLKIDILNCGGHTAPEPSSAVFDDAGGTIGRLPGNHLVLGDDSVSRRHARIVHENGRYYLVDESTNGTLIANRDLLLIGEKAELAHGDILQVGDCELAVSIVVESLDRKIEPAILPQEHEQGLSSLLDFPRGDRRTDAPAAMSPALEKEKTPALKTITSIDDLFDDAAEEEGPFPTAGHPTSRVVEEGGHVGEYGVPPIKPRPGGVMDTPIRPRKAPSVEHARTTPPSPSPPTSAPPHEVPEAVARPRVVTPTEVIQAVEPPSSPPPHEVPEAMARPRVATPTEETQLVAPPPSPVPPQVPEAVAHPIAATTPTEAAQVAAPPPSPPPHKAPEPRQLPPEVNNELFRLFLKGAQLDDPRLLERDDIPEIMENLGAVLREMVNGLWTILRGRAKQKAETRLSMTLLQPAANNPLKLSPRVEDALRLLLKKEHPSFLGPVESVLEGFADLMSHQMAMNAGIQASLQEALDKFDPHNFAEHKGGFFEFQKKAACWDAYCEAYGRIKDETMEDFFGKAFVQAYEEQMEKLCSRSKKS